MRWLNSPTLLGALLLAAPAAGQVVPQLTLLAGGLERPLIVAHAGDGSGRLFIGQQRGKILVHDGTGLLPQPFLDVDPLSNCCGERGLLGLAFHPAYAANGKLFVAYTDLEDDLVVARYTVSASDANRADPASREELLVVTQPYGNHNGGHLAFGPDGYLYIGSGDGGSGGDPQNRAQDLSTTLGKLLRIDVDSADPGLAYAVPGDNPFVGVAGAAEEIWAYGLRNPWRFSFDRETGDLWIGDVGQNAVEEIDLQLAASPGGENYGWRRMEGSSCFNPPTGCNDGSLILPVLEYSHAEGCSVTGGYRYRGAGHPRLQGIYLYADYCFGTVWGTVPRCDSASQSRALLSTGLNVSSFGEDEAGELLVVHLDNSAGAVYRIGLAPDSGGAAVTAPAERQLGAVPVNTLRTAPLELRNAHSGPEAAIVTAITSPDPTRFVLDFGAGAAPCGSPTPCLPPGAACTLEVEFSSPDAGDFTGPLRIEGNFAPRDVDLRAVAYDGCPVDEVLQLTGPPVTTEQTFEACQEIATGPEFEVTGSGRATLVAGTRVRLGDGTTVRAGGGLVIEIDPAVALP